MDLSGIEKYLTVLGLPSGKHPTLAEYKQAYREKLKLHPDKQHSSDDKAKDHDIFCDILEAAKVIFKFISENQHPEEKDIDKELLRTFEQKNGVKYNKGNITFHIEPGSGQLWINSLAKKVSEPVPLSNGSGVQMKIDEFKIPSVTYLTKKTYGSLSVTVWPNPSDGQPKVCVQGSMYLAFISFVLPLVLKDMESNKVGAIADRSDSHDITTNNENSDSDNIHDTIRRLEKEVVNISDNVISKVDKALANIPQEAPINSLLDRIEKLENILKSHQDQFNNLARAVEKLSETIATKEDVTLGEINKDIIKDAVHSHPMFDSIAEGIASIKSEIIKGEDIVHIEEQISENNKILKGVDTNTKAISTKIQNIRETSSASDKEISQLRKNSDESLKVFQSMKTSLDNLSSKLTLGAVSGPGPSTSSSSTNTAQQVSRDQRPQHRKGIMFASSLAKDLDIKRVEESLQCDIQVVTTPHIVHHSLSPDPDGSLQDMVKEHLVGKACYNFVIIACGSSDITSTDTINSNPVSLHEEVKSHTEVLCDIVQSITQDCGVDVFIVENPPRYDPTSSDPTALKQKLNKYSNSLLSTTLGLAECVFIVEQGSIARSSVKARNELYQGDGVHLTSKGLYYYSSNLISELQDRYEDTKQFSTTAADSERRGLGNNPSPGHDRGGKGRTYQSGSGTDQGGGRRQQHQQGRSGRYRDHPGNTHRDNTGWGRGFNRQRMYPPPPPARWYSDDYPGYGYGGRDRF